MNTPFRIGIGYDVHAFEKNRKLILGGVEIPFKRGLAGHSDADALLHAICDALLGSISEGDIGQLFPNTDPNFKDVNSLYLLQQVYKLVEEKGYILGNIDSMIVAEKPKLADYIPQMQQKIAEVLKADIKDISVKATTNEKLGFVGRGEGISAFASVLILKSHRNA